MRLRERWINLIYRSATSGKKIRVFLTPVGGVLYFTVIVLFIAISLWMDKFLGLPKFLSTPLNITVSVPIIAIGLFLILWSALHFFKIKGTPVPFHPPPKLVTAGPYAYVRNPMLTGIFIWLFGFGFLFRSISLVFIFTPLFILLNVLELKAIEEPELEKRLGREYVEYGNRVPMFIPWLGRNKK
ncbi:isoprenylcysteine carboxylmethyltransferase family protein [Candidatus Aerophobetes bacterium]|nr:isoprenylcysteine carboxylmethyltransferase family protein [Candidatus Aerophobetes bacterium]